MSFKPTVDQLLALHQKISTGEITEMTLGLFLEEPQRVIKDDRTSKQRKTRFANVPVLRTEYSDGTTILDLGGKIDVAPSGDFHKDLKYIGLSFNRDGFLSTLPPTNPATRMVTLSLFSVHNKDMIREEIAEEMEILRLRPAHSEELMALARCFPGLCKKHDIVTIFVGEHEGDAYDLWLVQDKNNTSIQLTLDVHDRKASTSFDEAQWFAAVRL